MKQSSYENKTIRCFWCKEYNNKTSMCGIRKVKLRAKAKRRCESFVPNYEVIDKEVNKGNNIKKYKRPEWYFLRGSERKKYIVKEEMKRMLNENQRNDAHPLTGALGNISSTAGVD